MKRRLSGDEAALWRRVAGTVTPLAGHGRTQFAEAASHDGNAPSAQPREKEKVRPSPHHAAPRPPAPASAAAQRPLTAQTLDSTWDRKLARGVISPDFTLDLHGHSLDAAHARLDHGLAQATAMGARIVLLITGRARPHDDHSVRGERRGAIRAKFADWLAHGPHASKIAAIRPAHPRHGGAGAVYIVLRRRH